MYRRLLAALAASAVLVAGVMPATALADSPTRQIQRAELAKIDPSFRPFLADAGRQVTVVLQLAADPALDVAGLTKTQQRTRANQIRTGQKGLDGRIRAAGGRVEGRYQYAYNGIKVRAAGTRLTALAAIPGVVAIRPLRTYERTNGNAVPYVGAPTAWQAGGATGAGQTIAVIDTGIDYTHATFGGAGTPEAWAANNSTVIEAGSFPTAKVVAGYDFAGNGYDANADPGDPASVPVPDADPLDCGNHGTHVSGTAAGQGVTAAHGTFTGPYVETTLGDPTAFVVSPGVAPEAKLVALKVFGCEGSTNLVVDALEWVAAYNASHADAIDVVNMSLGAPFGSNEDPDAVATNALVGTGVVVVASAGNESTVPYITGAPAAATRAISVAALDAFPTLPLATIDLPAGADIAGNNQNAYPALPVTGTLHVLADGAGGVKLGCAAADYGAPSADRIVAVKRGSCAFVDKGALAYAAGAIGIIVINRDDTAAGELPTFIGYNPELFQIPMVGTDKTAQAALLANEGATITLASAGSTANPTFREVADFSSSGPRWGDSWLKADVAAPGVNILSALNGSGWNGTTYSGTSMAAPMTSGAAALVRQAHPSWSPLKVKAALANTASASSAAIAGYDPLRAGSGVIQVDRAVATLGLATTSDRTASLSFGYEQIDGSYGETKTITISNTGSRDVWYTLTASSPLVTISPSRVKVDGRRSATVRVRASLSKAAVAALPSADQFITGDFGGLTSLSGVVVATPQTTRAGYFALRVPYLLVPRGVSEIDSELDHARTTGSRVDAVLKLENDGVHLGFADTYALGVTDARGDGAHGTDIRAIGVQSVPASVLLGADDPADRGIQFAVNMWDRFSTAAPHEVDIAVDTNGDGAPDRYVVGIDDGLIFAGAYDGLYLSLIFDAGFNLVDGWLADAPLNGSTLILPALASDLGLAEGDSSFAYWAVSYDGFTGLSDATAKLAAFDAFTPGQSTGDFVAVGPRARVTIPAWADRSAPGVRGWLVVSLDDRNGVEQADLIRLPTRH
ncbi:MAG: S8 family serine peptidase [Candidatus Limnocylindrales bacterium]